MNKNNNCDGSHCKVSDGEVRVLSAGDDCNIVLCKDCFEHEIAWRRRRNAQGVANAFKIQQWEDLEIYKGE